MYPSGRMSYDNPPRGITSTCSNLVDRWINVFAFHMIYPNVRNFLTYQFIFIVLFWSFIGIMPVHCYCNNISGHSFGSNNVIGINVVAFSNFTSFDLNLGDITYSQLFKSQFYVVGIWLISLCVIFIYLYALRSEKCLVPRHFPLTKVYRFWQDILTSKSNLNARMRRHICLCVLAEDSELYKVQDHFNFMCGFGREKCLDKLDRLWNTSCAKLHPGIKSNPNELRDVWLEVKYKMGHLNGSLDMFIEMVDAAIEEDIDEPSEVATESCRLVFTQSMGQKTQDIQMFLQMCNSFEEYVIAMNSFRFGKISNILNANSDFVCNRVGIGFTPLFTALFTLALGAAHISNSMGSSENESAI